MTRTPLAGDALTAFRMELLDLADVCVGELTVDLAACGEITDDLVAVLVEISVHCGLGRCVLRVVGAGSVVPETSRSMVEMAW